MVLRCFVIGKMIKSQGMVQEDPFSMVLFAYAVGYGCTKRDKDHRARREQKHTIGD